MKRATAVLRVAVVGVGLGLGLLVEPAAACPADSVQSGTVCMDKYEASVWYVPSTQGILINKIRKGTVKLADLTSTGAVAAGVVQLGLVFLDIEAAGCPDTGNGCMDFYAVSIPDVRPARFITWFQAAAAARNSFKRLPTNQEWQVAALGTPDGPRVETCNVNSADVANTRSAPDCISDVGAFDMVGNVWEWVGDWGDRAQGCQTWPAAFGSDVSCIGEGASESLKLPGAFTRGGHWSDGTFAGVFAVSTALGIPSRAEGELGFRCAR
jgi:hypothetical protein